MTSAIEHSPLNVASQNGKPILQETKTPVS
jgi:hypothetical protein